jgi:hypothetical protein
MQLSLALSALLTLFTGVSLAIPSPTRNVVNLSKRDISDGASGAAYTGRLYEPEQGITLNIGQHLNVAYDTSVRPFFTFPFPPPHPHPVLPSSLSPPSRTTLPRPSASISAFKDPVPSPSTPTISSLTASSRRVFLPMRPISSCADSLVRFHSSRRTFTREDRAVGSTLPSLSPLPSLSRERTVRQPFPFLPFFLPSADELYPFPLRPCAVSPLPSPPSWTAAFSRPSLPTDLIVTEHQRQVYVQDAGIIRVQSYNRSITIEEA